ncbi:MAG: hypothetical protein M1553_00935, partial [Firmicutes bacterium]|nr:hypothetical protein [Bacillota bacterium]
VRSFLKRAGYTGGWQVTVSSAVPVGKGMASSTADITAALGAACRIPQETPLKLTLADAPAGERGGRDGNCPGKSPDIAAALAGSPAGSVRQRGKLSEKGYGSDRTPCGAPAGPVSSPRRIRGLLPGELR